MKVTHVPLCATPAAKIAGRTALTPELLAASGARYSRNNDGLDSILEAIDWNDLDRSVDNIFKFVDYGHQSIADMVPVAMFMDDVSMILVYLIWSLCPTAGGQESSTRYIKINKDGLVDPKTVGIPDDLVDEWIHCTGVAFKHYETTLGVWDDMAKLNPTIMNIPQELLDDKSDKAQKTVARLRRNFVFDRSRYFLPVAAKTNFMMVMSARGWAQLCQYLCSCQLPEANMLGDKIRSELALVAPRMLRHAGRTDSFVTGIYREFKELCGSDYVDIPVDDPEVYPKAHLFAYGSVRGTVDALRDHDNRYSWVGSSLRRIPVQFGWQAVAMAELRDLNRHRTGSKYCPLKANGFYLPVEQVPSKPDPELCALRKFGAEMTSRANHVLSTSDPSYLYWYLLGSQFQFEHITTADKFIYEAELRTGVGAHFRYAKHLRDTLAIWYDLYPETRGMILEGTAEPE